MLPTRILLAVPLLAVLGESAKILGVIPTGGKSHHFVGVSFMKALAEAGHDVTVIGAFPEKNPPKNWQDIELTGMAEALQGMMEDPFSFVGVPTVMNVVMMYGEFGRFASEYTFNHPNMHKFMSSEERFDVVIVETFLVESLYGLAQHFNASLVTYSPLGSSLWTTDLTRTPAPTSYVPSFYLNYTDRMSFWQRFWNTLITMLDKALYRGYHLRVQKQLYDKAFPNARISFEEQMKSVSLVLLNHHFSLGFPVPLPPNMIEVGGIQIQEPKQLPKDLQTFLDEATAGAIYFSMGSLINCKDFPVEKRDAFIRAFSRLKQRVIWKFEDDSIPSLPSNLFIKPWMPQNDILAHPNVKVFITHGGLLGETEALYHGKPLIGIPVFGDQMMNIRKAVRAGYGVQLDFHDITEENVYTAINEVLSNTSYTDKASVISKRYRDKPMTAKETAVYWIEYVIRHQGAPHLRSPALELTLLQYNLIDVYAAIVALGCVIAFLNYRLARCLHRRICNSKSADKRKKE